jgi:methyl-accepting chemotaxis protein
MRIGVRLGIAFAVMVSLIVIMGVFGLNKLAGIQDQVEHIAKSNAVKLTAASNAQQAIALVYRSIDMLVLENKDASARSKYKDDLTTYRAKYAEAMKVLEEKETNEQGKAFIEKIKQALAAAKETNNKLIALAMDGKSDEAHDMMVKQAIPLAAPINKAFSDMCDYQNKRIDFRYEEAVKGYKAARIGFIIAMLLAVVIAFGTALFITKSITTPLGKMVDLLKDIASGEGDLTKHLDESAKDEIGDASRWFNVFVEKLRGIISQISSTSSQVASAAIQLNATAEQIATGAEEVAAQASTVATAGEEMSATSGDIAQNCQMAAEGAQRASQTAQNGAEVVEKTVRVMGQIAEKVQESAKTVESLGARSDQIGAIIGTIEDIADQTNLLALNAAIEAARAGEQGRGFAVVADEVRALAERTTRATREIGEMIKAIQKETKGAVAAMEIGVHQVEAGTEEAAKSGLALQEILQQVNDVAMQINQVATAAEEQTATTSEISSNMMQITEVVQQTSHGAHESATAASQLSGNAEELQRLVRQFKL